MDSMSSERKGESTVAPFYRGPYILSRTDGELRFIPAKQVGNHWEPLTPAEIEEQKS